MTNQTTRTPFRTANRIASILAAFCLASLSACTTTQKAPVTHEGLACALLGKLSPGEGGQAALRHVNPTARRTQHHPVMIAPVTFWGAESTQMSESDQEMLVNYCHQQRVAALGESLDSSISPVPASSSRT